MTVSRPPIFIHSKYVTDLTKYFFGEDNQADLPSYRTPHPTLPVAESIFQILPPPLAFPAHERAWYASTRYPNANGRPRGRSKIPTTSAKYQFRNPSHDHADVDSKRDCRGRGRWGLLPLHWSHVKQDRRSTYSGHYEARILGKEHG
jgi:hypothetical protein